MKQHAKPCSTCPFQRSCEPGELGGSPTETFIGQAFGGFWIPCHECMDYTDPDWRLQYAANQCAGAAIYRSNCHPAERPPDLLTLPENKELVFATPAEFFAHHKGIPLEDAQRILDRWPPLFWWMCEMNRPGARHIKKGSISEPS